MDVPTRSDGHTEQHLLRASPARSESHALAGIRALVPMSGRQPVPCDAVPMDTPERSRRVVDFRLANGEQIHAAHPETFEIPPRSQRKTLQPGDLAKLLFAVMEPSGDEPSAERMWVMVRQVIGGR